MSKAQTYDNVRIICIKYLITQIDNIDYDTALLFVKSNGFYDCCKDLNFVIKNEVYDLLSSILIKFQDNKDEILENVRDINIKKKLESGSKYNVKYDNSDIVKEVLLIYIVNKICTNNIKQNNKLGYIKKSIL